MNIDNIKRLQAFLRDLPPEKFNFDYVQKETDCGTVACACGWMLQIFPEFNITYKDNLSLCINDERMTYYGIAARVLDIPTTDAKRLFTPNHQEFISMNIKNVARDATPSEVADVLDQYITLKGK